MASLPRRRVMIALLVASAAPAGAQAQGVAAQAPQVVPGADRQALVARIDAVRQQYTSSRLSAARALETTGREADCVAAVVSAASAQRGAAAQRSAGGSPVKPPLKIKDVKPAYPAAAQRARVSGLVVVEGIVGPDGRLRCIRVLRSVPMLDQAAIDAVRQWEFTLTLMNGVPVPVIMTTTVNFTLQ